MYRKKTWTIYVPENDSIWGNTTSKNDVQIRQQLQTDLCQIHTFSVSIRNVDDKRIIMNSFSRNKLPSLILHIRYLIDNTLVNPYVVNNMCVECTLLLPGGYEDTRFTLVLFHTSDVAAYLTRNKANLVVSLLRRD